MTKFSQRYRVDNVPFYWLPLFWLYSYGLGVLYGLTFRFVRATIKKKYKGYLLDPDQNYIYAIWHRDVTSCYMLKPIPLNFAMINHPLWYMKPIHVSSRLTGVKEICLGSSGYGGKQAAKELVKYLKAGRSTFINPDGPDGPAYVAKKGALHLSKDSGLPIVPVDLQFSRCLELKGWDKKRIPLPFTTLTITYKTPILVTDENFEMAHMSLQQSIGI